MIKAYSLSVSFFLFSFNILSQVWQFSITPDYELSVRYKWGDLNEYDAKFIVRNQKIAFVKTIHVIDDQWGSLKFPEDFELTRGVFDSTQQYDFEWLVEVKKENVISENIHFDSSPNTIFQLTNVDVYPLIQANKINVWGDVTDAYKWTDKNGENIVIRSQISQQNEDESTRYLYVYHYLLRNGNYELLRKITDFEKDCSFDNLTNHIIESIELTDVDKDSIGEISFMYTVGCMSDVSPNTLKLMFLTQGQKFAIRGETKVIVSNENNEPIEVGGEFTSGKELEEFQVFKRFLENKWSNYINK